MQDVVSQSNSVVCAGSVVPCGTKIPPLFSQSSPPSTLTLTPPPTLHTLYNAEHDFRHCCGGVGGVGGVGDRSGASGERCVV